MKHPVRLKAALRAWRRLPPEVTFEQVVNWVHTAEPHTDRSSRWLPAWLCRVWKWGES